MSRIRIANYFKLIAGENKYLYQNYFVGASKAYLSESYAFVPFQAQGSLASLNGDNDTLSILFPNTEVAIVLLEQAKGNRLSELTFTTAWMNASDQIITPITDYYVGTGASVSETTIELRFRSAIDSVSSSFPARTLTRNLVGNLPLNSDLYLR